MARLLLIGNSRWHWAEAGERPWRCWHQSAAQAAAELQLERVQAWAAVGALPATAALPRERRIQLDHVPLQGLPPWLGVDRALVGWGAWRQQGHGVLVADAGTALSLTLIDDSGSFRGGRISAGVALQLQSLHGGTAQLPAVSVQSLPGQSPPGLPLPAQLWPIQTQAAMLQGCVRSTAAAIVQAWGDLQAAEPERRWSLWLTGGDAALLAPLLTAQQLEPVFAPDLALQALAALPAVGLQP